MGVRMKQPILEEGEEIKHYIVKDGKICGIVSDDFYR